MPYEYRIDTAAGLVLEEWRGSVTPDELLDCHSKQVADLNYRVDLHGVADFTEARLAVSSGEMRRLVDFVRSSESVMLARWALVAPRDVEYGLSRMYEALTHGERDIRVFRSRDEALAWLGTP